jgi:hypothetical protein
VISWTIRPALALGPWCARPGAAGACEHTYRSAYGSARPCWRRRFRLAPAYGHRPPPPKHGPGAEDLAPAYGHRRLMGWSAPAWYTDAGRSWPARKERARDVLIEPNGPI